MSGPADEPTRVVGYLRSLGLTKYEALVYIALLRVNDATASEIHGISGVPRASVYPVLDQLVQKELVTISLSSPKRFAALPPKEGIGNLLSCIERDAARAEEVLAKIVREQAVTDKGEQELIWNVFGIAAVRKKLADLLTHASHGIRLLAHPRILSDDLRKVIRGKARHIPVEVVTQHWEGDTSGPVKVYTIKKPNIPRDLDHAHDLMAGGIFIVDNRKVMVVVGSGHDESVALYSESAGFVRFFTRYYNFVADSAKKDGSR
jgi:sugar-specific transcriptional regulator TrmB